MSPFFSKAFGFDSSKHNVRTEIIAGLTTFLTIAYILAVNPSIFSALESQGMPTAAVFTATALAALVGTFVMALYAKKPFGLAPGMGLNAFFVFTVCLGMGLSWQFALTAVFLEGLIFILLTVTNIRTLIVDAIPVGMKNAIGVGIGLYIAFIGLRNVGLIVNNESTSVALGDLGSPEVILAIIGFFITSALVVLKVRGSLLIGILVTSLIGIPMGITKFTGVVSAPPSIEPIFCQFEWSQILSWKMLGVVITFLFIDMFDTIGTVVGVSVKSGMVDKDGKVEGIGKMLMADSVATIAGACFGTSTTTTYIESAAGVAEGGRTGLTSFTVAILFVLALFFSPISLAIPSAATGPVLVIVGVMMMSPVVNIDWEDYSEAIPALITMLLMPLAYSISEGILLGIISYVVINLVGGKVKKLNPTICVLAVLFICKYIFM